MGEAITWRATAIGVAAVVAGGLLAVGVAAHTSHHDSALNLNAFTNDTTNNYFYGAVTSGKSSCADARRVRIFRRRQGPDFRYGATRSHLASPGSGPYTVTAPSKGDLPEGNYYSQVKKRDLKPGNHHDHICRGAKSDNVDVGP